MGNENNNNKSCNHWEIVWSYCNFSRDNGNPNNLEIEGQALPRQIIKYSQSAFMGAWRYAAMGCVLLGDLYPSCEHAHCLTTA
jgi:hypothetical protein